MKTYREVVEMMARRKYFAEMSGVLHFNNYDAGTVRFIYGSEADNFIEDVIAAERQL